MKLYGPLMRLALCAAILWRVYGETGPWTVLALAFITLALEICAWTTDRHLELIVLLRGIVEQSAPLSVRRLMDELEKQIEEQAPS